MLFKQIGENHGRPVTRHPLAFAVSMRGWRRRALQGLVLLLWMPLATAADPWSGLGAALQQPGLVSDAFRDELTRFYAQRGYRPLWFDRVQPTTASHALRAVLADAAREGLNPADYDSHALRSACGDPPADPVACELGLTDSLLRYARDVGYGVLQPSKVDPDWHIPAQSLPLSTLLEQLSTRTDLTDWLRQLPPPHVAYQQLRAALATYYSSDRAIRWLPIPDGSSLRPGETDDRVLALRERLGVEQPSLLDSVAPAHFDEALATAVRVFQAQHGLDDDGIVGAKTLAALNVTPSERLAQLRVNMERWRWLPRDLGDTHILVNSAGFDLTLVQPGEPVLRLRAISGRPDRTSPSLLSKVNRLVLNPDWTVPRRIAVEDMLPQLKRDPNALQAKNIQVMRRENGQLVIVDPLTIDWQRHSKNNFPFVLRQGPGANNSLGKLKFVMPNPYDIYIHDTPAKGLYTKTVRTLSSGCIRVDQPLELASRLLGQGSSERTVQWLQQRIAQGDTDNVPLSRPVPVYLVYLTAWVDPDGNFQFRDDVYGRDARMQHRFAFQ